MKFRIFLFALFLAVTCGGVPALAQTATTPTPQGQPAPEVETKKQITTTAAQQRIVVESAPGAPQVVTLLHRLSGLKMFRLLLRSGEARAIERLDEHFTIDGNVHTNVIAGLALPDGKTVAAWLPELGAEIGPMPAPDPTVTAGSSATATPRPVVTANKRFGLVGAPNVTVVARDHRRLAAKYVGLDGVTGLSILQLPADKLTAISQVIDAEESSLAIGQRVHLFAPEPAKESQSVKPGTIYAKLGETEARISRVMRVPNGGVARVQIVSSKLSPANLGGVVLNDAGQTVGIIDSVKHGQATVLPATLVRGAAKRVLERQASVPRPWLGIRGEALNQFHFEQLLRNGWQSDVASTLARQQRGILLTSVLPGSPASTAELKPGDVILRVNEGAVNNAEDFSWVLEEAGAGGSLRFTVARPGKAGTEAVDVKLSESPDPFYSWTAPKFKATAEAAELATLDAKQSLLNASLLASGIETITLLPRVASRLGSSGGLLVISVEPNTVPFAAGLRPGDVIESINGQPLREITFTNWFHPGETYTCTVVRKKQKLELTFEFKPKL